MDIPGPPPASLSPLSFLFLSRGMLGEHHNPDGLMLSDLHHDPWAICASPSSPRRRGERERGVRRRYASPLKADPEALGTDPRIMHL